MFPDVYANRPDPEVIQGKPPKNAGPYHNYGAAFFVRDQEALFAKQRGYSKVYLWTTKEGERILTLCERDLIQEER